MLGKPDCAHVSAGFRPLPERTPGSFVRKRPPGRARTAQVARTGSGRPGNSRQTPCDAPRAGNALPPASRRTRPRAGPSATDRRERRVTGRRGDNAGRADHPSHAGPVKTAGTRLCAGRTGCARAARSPVCRRDRMLMICSRPCAYSRREAPSLPSRTAAWATVGSHEGGFFADRREAAAGASRRGACERSEPRPAGYPQAGSG